MVIRRFASHPITPLTTTLCLIIEPDRILLGLKKRGFGAGRYNGFGGKVEPRETLEQAARRELYEEAGVRCGDLEYCGHLSFTFAHGLRPIETHVFRTGQLLGTPRETDEMKPEWFTLNERSESKGLRPIPYPRMWADDRHWLPKVVAGQSIRATFHFHDEHTVHSFKLQELAPTSLSRHN